VKWIGVIGTTRAKHHGRIPPLLRRSVDVCVVAGGISFCTTFLREEDSKKSKEDHRTVEEHIGREISPYENNKV
jgi:hypothetical protein